MRNQDADLAVLQVVRLKGGLADATTVAVASALSKDDVAGALAAFSADGLVQERRGRYRLTPDGREALDGLLAGERETVDASEIAAVYEEFVPFNVELKEIAHAWQVRGDEPNDHADDGYDAAVVGRLEDLHERFEPVVRRIGASATRLGTYGERLARALREIRGGDRRFLLSPVVDSYHQVWFELHEELILIAGHDRQTEAAAGRAE